MTSERDPMLQSLFAEAGQELAGEEFTAQVMTQIGRRKKRKFIGWVCVVLALAVCAWLIATPVQEAVQLLVRGLTASLINIDDHFFAQLLSPINNVMILLALGPDCELLTKEYFMVELLRFGNPASQIRPHRVRWTGVAG